MATCDEVRGTLADYIEDALPPAERERTAEHLEFCDGCRQEFAELQAVTGLLSGWTPPEPPANLWEGVAARIGSDLPPASGGGAPLPFISWKLLVTAAVVIGGATSTYLWFGPSRTDYELLPRYQDSLIQTNHLENAPAAFSDPARRIEPVLQRERAGMGICR